MRAEARSGSDPIRRVESLPRAVPRGGVVAVAVVGDVGVFIVRREPPRHADHFEADRLGGRRRVVEDHGRGENEVERLVGKREHQARAENQVDPIEPGQVVAGEAELACAEVDADHRHVEIAPDRAKLLAVATADLQDRRGAIRGNPTGDPLGTRGPCRLVLLLSKILLTAAEGPVFAWVRVDKPSLPARPATERASQGLVPDVARPLTAPGTPGSDRQGREMTRRVAHRVVPFFGKEGVIDRTRSVRSLL